VALTTLAKHMLHKAIMTKIANADFPNFAVSFSLDSYYLARFIKDL